MKPKPAPEPPAADQEPELALEQALEMEQALPEVTVADISTAMYH